MLLEMTQYILKSLFKTPVTLKFKLLLMEKVMQYILVPEIAVCKGDIKKLYVGKIGIQHLHLLDEGILIPASVLPTFLK